MPLLMAPPRLYDAGHGVFLTPSQNGSRNCLSKSFVQFHSSGLNALCPVPNGAVDVEVNLDIRGSSLFTAASQVDTFLRNGGYPTKLEQWLDTAFRKRECTNARLAHIDPDL